MVKLELPQNKASHKILAKITDLVRDNHTVKIVFNECKPYIDSDKFFYAIMGQKSFDKLEIGKTYILLMAKGVNYTCYFQGQVIDEYYIIYDIKPVIY